MSLDELFDGTTLAPCKDAGQRWFEENKPCEVSDIVEIGDETVDEFLRAVLPADAGMVQRLLLKKRLNNAHAREERAKRQRLDAGAVQEAQPAEQQQGQRQGQGQRRPAAPNR